MQKQSTVKQIFEPDEMKLRPVRPEWDAEDLLCQEGIFFLKDVAKALKLDSVKVKKRAKSLHQQSLSAWALMGARRVWNHWIVRMKVFAPYYREHLVSRIRTIEDDWDGNILLQQKGLFHLSEVCRLIPFSTHQLRYQAKNNPRAKEEYGIWKDEELKTFVVDMERFSPWINGLWEGHFPRRKR